MNEPFGYFRAEPFGWTDCGPDDDGAKALYEWPADTQLTDAAPELLAALKGLIDLAGPSCVGAWDVARAAIAKAEGNP